MTKLKITLKGSPSSGNYGHAGRPGKVGGSAPSGGKAKKPTKRKQTIKMEQGSEKLADSLRGEVETNFPKGDRLGYALGAIGDAYVGDVITSREGGKLVGIATLLRDPSNKRNPISISYIATSQKGVGKGMMDKIKGITRKDNTTLYAEPSTKGATAFFKKMGFKPSETTGSVGEFMVWAP